MGTLAAVGKEKEEKDIRDNLVLDNDGDVRPSPCALAWPGWVSHAASPSCPAPRRARPCSLPVSPCMLLTICAAGDDYGPQSISLSQRSLPQTPCAPKRQNTRKTKRSVIDRRSKLVGDVAIHKAVDAYAGGWMICDRVPTARNLTPY